MKLNEASLERLWKMFFPHLTRNCGMALVAELLNLRVKNSHS